MLRIGMLLTLMLATLTSTMAQFDPTSDAPVYRVRDVQASPRGDLQALLMALPPGQAVDASTPLYQQWVADSVLRDTRCLLHSGDWPSEVHFSPDEFIIALQSTSGQASGELLLFKRREGVRYDQVAGLDAQLWAYCLAHHPEVGDIPAAARQTRFVAWGSDSAALLVALSGEGSAGRVRDWLVACDVTKSSPTLDLNLLNRAWPQTQNLAPDALETMPLDGTIHTFDRLAQAFALLTQPSGGVETLPQPGDKHVADADETAPLGTPMPTPTPLPPQPRRLRASADGTALLYALTEPPPTGVKRGRPGRDWFCLYDMTTNRPTMDLGTINRGAVSGK